MAAWAAVAKEPFLVYMGGTLPLPWSKIPHLPCRYLELARCSAVAVTQATDDRLDRKMILSLRRVVW